MKQPDVGMFQTVPIEIMGDFAALEVGHRTLCPKPIAPDLIPCLCFMLDQQRLFLVAAVKDLADDDVDVAALPASVRLDRLAPATVEQRAGRRYPGRRWAGLLADDPGKRLDAQLGVPPRQ
jgi:hypothetical protein